MLVYVYSFSPLIFVVLVFNEFMVARARAWVPDSKWLAGAVDKYKKVTREDYKFIKRDTVFQLLGNCLRGVNVYDFC